MRGVKRILQNRRLGRYCSNRVTSISCKMTSQSDPVLVASMMRNPDCFNRDSSPYRVYRTASQGMSCSGQTKGVVRNTNPKGLSTRCHSERTLCGWKRCSSTSVASRLSKTWLRRGSCSPSNRQSACFWGWGEVRSGTSIPMIRSADRRSL